MPVPSYRVPVRVARGTKAALDAGLADLQEGEVCYATDENALYVVESGVLTPAGSAISAASIGDLADVVVTSASTGEVLRYNGTSWVDAQLAYSDLSGTPTLGTAAAANTGDFATAAQGALADTAIQPADSIDALADVDTTTSAPTNGQVLQWNGTNWVPATGGGGAVDSVNGKTGVVVLTIDDLDDVETTSPPASDGPWSTNGSASNIAGCWRDFADPVNRLVYFNVKDDSGVDVSAPYLARTAGQSITFSGDNVTWYSFTLEADASLANGYEVRIKTAEDPSVVATFTTLYVAIGTGTAPSDGQVLTWVASNSRWEPATPAPGGGGGGAGAIQTSFTTESQTASSGAATFSGIGQSGQLVSVASTLDAWIVLYPTAADRTADAGRAYGTDPAPGSGVLAEFYVTSGGTILATPGTTYFNNDATKASAIYAAVRNQAGANVDSGVTLACYAASGVLGYRTTISATTASLANGAAGDITFSGTGKSGRFISVETDRAAWVTLYISAAARTADASRPEGTDPTGGAGVLAEAITAGADVVKFTPALGYFNDEATPVSELYAKVVNKSGGTSTVQVDLTIVPAEA